MTEVIVLCPSTDVPARRCTCPDHLGGRAEVDGVQVVSGACGTRAGYLRHCRRKEPACDPCTEANAAHRRAHFDGTRERNRRYQRAQRRAVARMQAMAPATWRKLLNEELARAGLLPGRVG